MTIPQKVLAIWESKYERGDYEAISKKTGKSRMTIKRAMKDGNCTEELFEKIFEFYAEKIFKKAQLVKAVEDYN